MTETIQKQPIPNRKMCPSATENVIYDSNSTRLYRNAINQHLATIANKRDNKLELNQHGICHFQCCGFQILIEVPWDSKVFFLYTCIMKCLPSSTPIMRKALEMNYLTQSTNGCTLSLDPTKQQDMEIVLSRSERIDGIDPSSLLSSVQIFVRTATSVHKQLEKAQRSRTSFMTSLPLRRSSTIRGNRSRKGRQSDRPPPAPRDKDVTPTISNKTTDKSMLRRIPRNSNIQDIQKSASMNDYAKVQVTLGLTTATTAGRNPYATTSKGFSRASDHRPPEGVIRRLSRMASKTVSPRASFSRHRQPPRTIVEAPMDESAATSGLEI